MNKNHLGVYIASSMLAGALFTRFLHIMLETSMLIEATLTCMGAAAVVGFMIWYSQQ